jgi:putative flavoprotein involved in K+ transport
VLLVGGGNTGFQIAEELAATHDVHLSVGSRQTPLPQRMFGRDLFTLLDKTRLMAQTVDSRLGRRLKDRETLIGSRPRRLRRKHGVTLRPRTTAAEGNTISFEDGTKLDVSSVIWATGFGLDHAFVDVPVFDEQRGLVHQRGVTASPGLYFLGIPWLHTRGSALLGWVKDDAEYLAEHIRAFAAAATAPPRPDAATITPDPIGEHA